MSIRPTQMSQSEFVEVLAGLVDEVFAEYTNVSKNHHDKDYIAQHRSEFVAVATVWQMSKLVLIDEELTNDTALNSDPNFDRG